MAHFFPARHWVRFGLVGTLLVLLCLSCARGEPTEQITAEPTATALKSPTPPPAEPTPTITPSPLPVETQATPRHSLDKQRFQTAIGAFAIAREAALAWRQDVLWYSVMPSSSLERALALPMAKPGWVFRFGAPQTTKEYIIHVVEGECAGNTEMRIPDYIEPPLSNLEPLDMMWKELLDSSTVLEEYNNQDTNLLTQYPNMNLDYRLIHPKECEHPLWMLFDAMHLATPIFVIDATTGETVADPPCGAH